MSDQFPPQGPWGQQPGPHAQQPWGQPAYGGYATWVERVVGTLWDILVVWKAVLLIIVAVIVIGLGAVLADDNEGAGNAVIVVGGVLAFAGYLWAFWLQIKNVLINQGRTGYTWGKGRVGIRLISEQTGRPVGPWVCLARILLHNVLNYCVCIDYLWPLWDAKSQTLADKIVGTVVVRQR